MPFIMRTVGDMPYYRQEPPPKASIAAGCLPLGLAHKVKLKRAIAAVEIDETTTADKQARWMEGVI